MECFLQQGSFSYREAEAEVEASDDSFVDQLLNLSPENTLDDVIDHSTASLLSPYPLPLPPSPAAEDADFDSLLALPEEGADLEWLSRFVEDSFSQFCHAAKPMPEKLQPPRFRRTKRVRPTVVRSWSLASSSASSSPSSSATSSPYWPTSPTTPDQNSNKKGRAEPESKPGCSAAASRRCSHCGTQKTPQWRAGPMGSKTLCNACGVRFKTGRLLPEYRPACSPTFSSVLHSNSHRKVLEMRRSKEAMGPTQPGALPAGPV